MKQRSLIVIIICLLVALPALAFAQAEPGTLPALAPKPARPAIKPADEPTSSEPAAENPKPRAKENTKEADPLPAAAPVNPRQFRFVLVDGSVLSGELVLEQVNVETKYGPLAVPLADVQSLTPGLASHPELAQQFDSLLERLGGDDFKAREQAQRELVRFGPAIRQLLNSRAGDENAERRRRIQELGAEIDQQEEARNAFEEPQAYDAAWIRQDTVVTAEFTAVGKISPTTLKVNSKYGPFTLQLADVRCAEREAGRRPAYYKSLTVDSSNQATGAFKETSIKLQKGDRVTVRAEGTLSLAAITGDSEMTASADGDARFGWYVPNQIRGGALVGRLGKEGTVFVLGKNKSFVAETSGDLELAVAVPPEYAMNEGFTIPGAFTVKLKIEPR